MNNEKERVEVIEELRFDIDNNETVIVYREMRWGHCITVIRDKNNKTVAVHHS
jgi:hypothetical protein